LSELGQKTKSNSAERRRVSATRKDELMLKPISAAIVSLVAAGGAFAQAYSDTAQVISAQPIYERVSAPRQECFNETVTMDRRTPSPGYQDVRYTQPAPSERSVGAGTILGAVIGGVVGHQFGNSSRGRDHGTVAGVIGGGIIGNMIENSQPNAVSYDPQPARVDYTPETRTVQRCQTVQDSREQISGYNVTYRYNGRDYQTRMSYDPGPTINVRVNLAPEIRNYR
jgi:uncharacterized protein YcfJ